jgi:hypothetical protein
MITGITARLSQLISKRLIDPAMCLRVEDPHRVSTLHALTGALSETLSVRESTMTDDSTVKDSIMRIHGLWLTPRSAAFALSCACVHARVREQTSRIAPTSTTLHR